MFSHCIFCYSDLAHNQDIAAFPTGDFQPGARGQPTSFPEAAAEYSVRPVRLQASDGIALEAVVLHHRRRRGVLLYFGGNSLRHCPSSFSAAAGRSFVKGVSDLGLSVVLVNYRGYGASAGQPSFESGQADAISVIDYVRGDAQLGRLPLVVHGQSLGSVFATHAVLHRPARALVLESPPTTIDEVLDAAVPWYTKLFLRLRVAPELKRQDHRAMVGALRLPVLLVVGTTDRLTPPKMAKELHRRVPAPGARLALIRGGSHGDLVMHAEFWTVLESFVEQQLGSAQ